MNVLRKLGLMFGLSLSILSVGNASAQEHSRQGNGMPVRHERKMKSPEERAQMKADAMRRQLRLDEKTYKKIYKHFLEQYNYVQENFGPQRPGRHGRMVAPMEGQRREERPERFEAGKRPQGGNAEVQHGRRPVEGQRHGRPVNEDMKKYLDRQDGKLRKILSPEQYREWMATHPSEYRPER